MIFENIQQATASEEELRNLDLEVKFPESQLYKKNTGCGGSGLANFFSKIRAGKDDRALTFQNVIVHVTCM